MDTKKLFSFKIPPFLGAANHTAQQTQRQTRFDEDSVQFPAETGHRVRGDRSGGHWHGPTSAASLQYIISQPPITAAQFAETAKHWRILGQQRRRRQQWGQYARVAFVGEFERLLAHQFHYNHELDGFEQRHHIAAAQLPRGTTLQTTQSNDKGSFFVRFQILWNFLLEFGLLPFIHFLQC